MRTKSMLQYKIIGFSISVLFILIDQIFKIMAAHYLEPVGYIRFLDPVIHLKWLTNDGAAWGSFAGNKFILIGVTSVLLLAAIILICKNMLKDRFLLLCACVIISGGAGNLIDRVLRGYVIDYLEFGFFQFPVFNFADMCVTVGAVVFCIYYIFFYEKNTSHKLQIK